MKLMEVLDQLRTEREALQNVTAELREVLHSQALTHDHGPSTMVASAVDFTHIECYKLCHDKLCSENELTNNRLSWNFTIQGFLFAAYALTLQTTGTIQVKLAEIPRDADHLVNLQYLTSAINNLHTFLRNLAWTGFFVSLLILLGASAAQWAIVSVRDKFHESHPEHTTYIAGSSRWFTHAKHFPGVTGGGNKWAHRLGVVPLVIPLVFMGVWLRVLLAF